jgi:hypothetical protein
MWPDEMLLDSNSIPFPPASRMQSEHSSSSDTTRSTDFEDLKTEILSFIDWPESVWYCSGSAVCGRAWRDGIRGRSTAETQVMVRW